MFSGGELGNFLAGRAVLAIAVLIVVVFGAGALIGWLAF